jgi:hypothetical protein
MKQLVAGLVALTFLSAASLLADDKSKEGKFEEHKAHALKRIEERMAKMTEHKNCMAAATNKESMKACHEKMKEWMKAQRKEHKGHREHDEHDD